MTWQERAVCKGLPITVMVPARDGHHEVGKARRSTPTRQEQDVIDRFCSVCPVREDCLADALENRDLGIRGGTIDEQRRRARRVVRPVVEGSGYRPHVDPGPKVEVPEHGIRQGYVRGCRCADCRCAAALYRRDERGKRKPATTDAAPTAAGSPEENTQEVRASSGARSVYPSASWKRLHRVVVR